MPKGNFPLLAFNRGLVSPLTLARTDVERVRLSAETMENFLPKTQGPMYLRQGMTYLGSSYTDASAKWIPFIASTTDFAALEITNLKMRVWIGDSPLSRVAVATTISNGTFTSSAGWTDTSTGGGLVTFNYAALPLVSLNGYNRGGLARFQRQVSVAPADSGKEHALRILINRGPVTFRCGSTSGGDEYVGETTLHTGWHSLAFTPTTDIYLTFQSSLEVDKIVASVAIEAAGTVEITAPWPAASLSNIATEQSADVMFVACTGYQQRRIERRGTGRSWSVVTYQVDDGPFTGTRTARAKMKVSATSGVVYLYSDVPFFRSTHTDALFRLFHKGWNGTFYLGAEDTYSDPIRVTGINDVTAGKSDRNWSVTVSGSWTGTLTIQRSTDDATSGYVDYTTISANGTTATNDDDDNSITYYRVGFKPGAYGGGSATVVISYDGGGDYGICRVLGMVTATQVVVEVLRPFTSINYTTDWREGYWSDRRGWPSAVALYDGRLWWANQARYYGSVSDAYDSYSTDVEGDSAAILRSFGRGPIDRVNWILPVGRLIIGTAGAEQSIRSTTLDEALTPTNVNVKECSTQGSSTIPAVKVDQRGIYVQRSGERLFELVYDAASYDYNSKELTQLAPEIAEAGAVWIAVQRQPDTRIHVGLADGTVAVLTYEPGEEVFCWSKVTTDGFIEAGFVLPGTSEDRVYYHVRRTINSVTKRYLEKWSLEREIRGGTTHLQLDAQITITGSAMTTITGLGHLEGKSVAVWNGTLQREEIDVDGNVKLFTVTGGQITGVTSTSSVVVGLPYTATFKSTKLAYAAALGSALTQPKRVNYLGLILARTHFRGLLSGQSFDVMDPLPLMYNGAQPAEGTIYSAFDEPAFEVPGEWDTDARLCLQASAPRPCTVVAAIVGQTTNDKA